MKDGRFDFRLLLLGGGYILTVVRLSGLELSDGASDIRKPPPAFDLGGAFVRVMKEADFLELSI